MSPVPDDQPDILPAFEIPVDAASGGEKDLVQHALSLAQQQYRQYQETDILSQLEEAISILSEAGKAIVGNTTYKTKVLNNCGVYVRARYLKTKSRSDLEEAIRILRSASNMSKRLYDDGGITQGENPVRARIMHNLSLALENSHEENGTLHDLEEAIDLTRAALSITTGSLIRAKYSICLGRLLYESFQFSHNMTDLDEAIRVTHIALTLVPDGTDQVQALNHLAKFLHLRYRFRGASTDLNEAIRIARMTVRVVMQDNVKESKYLYRLGCWLAKRHSLNESEADLEDSIQFLQAAVEITPNGHATKVLRQAELAKQYNSRYMRNNDLRDIRKASKILWAAIEEPCIVDATVPETNINILRQLHAYILSTYLRSDTISDLNELIRVTEILINTLPSDNTYRAEYLAGHAAYLRARYGKLGEMSDLEEAIHLTQVAIDGLIDDKWSEAKFSKQLRVLRCDISLRVGVTSDLHEAAVQITRAAVSSATPEDASVELKYLDAFMIHLGDLCTVINTITFNKHAILIMRSASSIAPALHPAHITISKHLSDILVHIFEQTFDLDFLNDAIRVLKESLKSAPDGHCYVEAMLCTLRSSVLDVYEETQELTDLEDVVDILKSTLHLDPNDYAAQSTTFYTIGNCLGKLYALTHNLNSLDEAIGYSRKAIEISAQHSDKKRFLASLGGLIGTRYRATGNLSDIEEAIQLTRVAAEEATGKLKKVPILDNLGHLLQARFETTGVISDLQEAVQIGREVVNGVPGVLSRPVYLNSLCMHLRFLFIRTRNIDHLEEAIRVQRGAITKDTQPDPERSMHLLGLADSLYLRYTEIEVESDLEEAIKLIQEAIDITAESSPNRVTYLTRNSVYFIAKYERTGGRADLDEAVRVAYVALDAVPKGHPSRAGVLEHLGNGLIHLYTSTGVVYELQRAIEFAEEAVEITLGGPEHAEALNCLAVRLSERYKGTGELADIVEAARLTRLAFEISLKAEDKVRHRKYIALHLRERYQKTQQLADLDEAIEAANEAVSWTPNDHPYHAEAMGTLATILEERYSRTKAVPDIQRAITCHQAALMQSNAQVRTRIEGGTDVVRCCALISDWQQAYEAVLLVVSLIPTLISRSHKNSDKQNVLRWVAGIASDAAATALNAAKGPYSALNLLEQSRGLLATSLEEMRADILNLREKHPQLAEEFIRLQGELNLQASSRKALHSSDDTQSLSIQVHTSQAYQTDKAFDQLLVKIRDQPDFRTFLLLPSEEEMKQAALKGSTIVVINVSNYRSDAILVQENQIRVLPLPSLRKSDVDEKSTSSNLGASHILAWLWDVIASPVLNAIGCSACPSEEKWRRVWWIPVGPLSRFPLHAAGRHFQGTRDVVIDRVMSSYNSSIKAIIRGRQRPLLWNVASTVRPRALLVAMRDTPGYPRLRYANVEVETLRSICETMAVDIVDPGQFRDEIIAQLPECSIFHFAGHGYTHRGDPSQSHLVAYDGRITVASLLEMDLRKRAPFLAYLSACGTGRVRDDDFLDESMHLISAFQLGGFRHVIGTLWEVNDKSCTKMAKVTYEGIRNGGMTDDSVCLGLHNASRELRDTWLEQSSKESNNKSICGPTTLNGLNVGKIDTRMREGQSRLLRDIVPDEDDDDTEGSHPAFWIPYVHFGV
ncbi:hypothetical protein NPX13_g2971 [Xylaria arbuscula]|uniref:CHAT domain-containing protein n=1 Tax=Xylaria arbuscula TaxID=114810 RepID=A0A9W8TNN4_9PEZI|nr:hypothetical protein NPX13_g2971 [Xylaria arbuscula]